MEKYAKLHIDGNDVTIHCSDKKQVDYFEKNFARILEQVQNNDSFSNNFSELEEMVTQMKQLSHLAKNNFPAFRWIISMYEEIKKEKSPPDKT